MADTKKGTDSDASLVFIIGLITAGLTLGFGLRSLYWSFGLPHSAQNLSLIHI